MPRRRALISMFVLAAVVVVAYLWWPSVVQAFLGMHGPFGGGPGAHFSH